MALLRVVLRGITIVTITLHYCFAIALEWTIGVAVGASRSTRLGRLGRRLASLFERLGPVFLKLGQVMSTRPDLLPSEITVALARLRDSVMPEPEAMMSSWLRACLRKPVEELFARFDWDVLAAGSIAQVHSATLTDGRSVVVKIRRPNIERRIRLDLSLLSLIAGSLERFGRLRHVPIQASVNELALAIVRQLDFEAEAKACVLMRERYGCLGEVRIPWIVPELCTQGTIVMERIAALPQNTDVAYSKAIRVGLRCLYRMLFIDGLVHADLHLGNVRFTPEGELVLLDFGLVSHLSAPQRAALARLFLGLATGNASLCARALLNTALSTSEAFEFNLFERGVAAVVNQYAGRDARTFDVARFVGGLFDVQRRTGVRATSEFTTAVVSLLAYEGMVKQFCPELDFQSEALPFVMLVLAWDEAATDVRHRLDLVARTVRPTM